MFRIRVTYSGVPVVGAAVSTFYFHDEVHEAQDAVDSIEDAFAIWRTAMVSQLTIASEAEVAVVDPSTGTVTGMESTTPWSTTGSVGSATPLPPECQALVRWRTGVFVGGREIRGRTFLPGFASGYVDANGGVPAAQRTIVNNGAAVWVAAGAAASRVFSPTHLAAYGIESGSCWTKYASLRSRRD